MTEMTPKGRKLRDARAEYEDWCRAWEILEPLAKAAEAFGQEQLIELMGGAMREADRKVNLSLDVVERLQGEASETPSDVGRASAAAPDGPTPGRPDGVLVEVNHHLTEASALLSESWAPTDEQADAELEARQAISEAGLIVAKLISAGVRQPEA